MSCSNNPMQKEAQTQLHLNCCAKNCPDVSPPHFCSCSCSCPVPHSLLFCKNHVTGNHATLHTHNQNCVGTCIPVLVLPKILPQE